MSAPPAVVEVFDPEQAAALLRCSVETVRDRAREFGGLKFGRDWIFPAATFYAALNAMAQETLAASKAPPVSSRGPSAVLTQVPPRRQPPALPRLDAPST
jgi:hypothetical protein